MKHRVSGKVVVVGGHDTWLKRFKHSISGNVKYIDREKDFPFSMIKDADVVWIQLNAVSHGQVTKVKKYAELYKVPLMFFNYAGVQRCVDQLIGGAT